MNSTEPLVSIIIPTFNRAHLINETLDSVMVQTYKNWECIIVDDGSTDKTESVVKDYTSENFKFRFYKRPSNLSKGANSCRNYGLEKSNGEYVVFLDSDDLIIQEKLQIQVKMLKEQPSKIACISQSDCFVGNNKEIIRKFGDVDEDVKLVDLISKKTAWGLSSGVWLKKSLGNKPFDPHLQGGQDWCFHIKQAIKNPNLFIILDKVTVLVRLDNKSISRSNDYLYTLSRIESRIEVLNTLCQRSENKEEIEITKVEILKRIIRFLPVRSFRLLPLIEYSLHSQNKYFFNFLYFIFRKLFTLHKTYPKFLNNLAGVLSYFKSIRTELTQMFIFK